MPEFREKVEFEDVECERETDAALLCWVDGAKHWIPKQRGLA